MSSDASTEPLSHAPRARGDAAPDALQPWQLFTLAGLIGATVVVFVSRGQTPAGIVLLSLTIFAAAVVGLAAWRTFAPLTAAGDSTPPMAGGRTRAALEREKTLALRAIKDLEFDRAMGKVSEKDFAEMSARLRVRAVGLMRQLDAGAVYRDTIEREVARRLGDAATAGPPAAASADPAASPAAAAAPATGGTRPSTCAACATVNDADARFCKRCGAPLGDVS